MAIFPGEPGLAGSPLNVLLHKCYYNEFGHSTPNRMGISRVPKIGGRWAP